MAMRRACSRWAAAASSTGRRVSTSGSGRTDRGIRARTTVPWARGAVDPPHRRPACRLPRPARPAARDSSRTARATHAHLLDAIAQRGGALELERARGFEHLGFELLDQLLLVGALDQAEEHA